MHGAKITRKSLDRQELSNKPTLVLTRALKQKIDFLHKKVGSSEWSGELITREEGTINDLQDWKIIAEDIYLADVGSPGYTEYTVGEGGFKSNDIIELYEQFPELEDGTQKLQHIHSHHNMSCFFSGTDWDNLNDRALVSNYFLMLIVNFDGKYCAKVAFRAKKEGGNRVTLSFINNSDGYKALELGGKDEDNEVLVVMDCDIEIEGTIDVPAEFEQRFERVKQGIEDDKKKKEEDRKGKKWGVGFEWGKEQGQLPFGRDKGNWKEDKWTPNESWDSNNQPPWNSLKDGKWQNNWEWNTETGMWAPKEKKISNMTDREFQQFEADEEAKRVFGEDQQKNTKFEEKHARAFLNSILDGTYMMNDYRDIREPMLLMNRELKGTREMEAYVDIWEDMLGEHFEVIFPKAPIEKYLELLNAVHKYLSQYNYIRLVQDMLVSVKTEIEMNNHPLKPA